MSSARPGDRATRSAPHAQLSELSAGIRGGVPHHGARLNSSFASWTSRTRPSTGRFGSAALQESAGVFGDSHDHEAAADHTYWRSQLAADRRIVAESDEARAVSCQSAPSIRNRVGGAVQAMGRPDRSRHRCGRAARRHGSHPRRGRSATQMYSWAGTENGPRSGSPPASDSASPPTVDPPPPAIALRSGGAGPVPGPGGTGAVPSEVQTDRDRAPTTAGRSAPPALGLARRPHRPAVITEVTLQDTADGRSRIGAEWTLGGIVAACRLRGVARVRRTVAHAAPIWTFVLRVQ